MSNGRYTNYAKFLGVPCYYGAGYHENFLRGRTELYDCLLPVVSWFYNLYSTIRESVDPEWESLGFPILIGPELPPDLAAELEREELDAQS